LVRRKPSQVGLGYVVLVLRVRHSGYG
jgi:hypothetical protein